MKIVADENMPKIAELFGALGDIHYVNGRELSNKQLIELEADALLVRSVTKVNESLLRHSNVRFVGSATIGVDHIDLDYLEANGIGFASAPGCNADAVADYVISALSYLYEQKNIRWLEATIGVVGYGNVGSTVYQRLMQLGCKISVFDPFKAQSSKAEEANFSSLEEVLASQVIILHTPYTTDGDYPTKHMLNADMLKNIRRDACIINAGRGGVIDESALQSRKRELGGQLSLIFDVWEGEPNIDLELLKEVDIATPHIAGYSLQGREKGSWMIYDAFCQYFKINTVKQLEHTLSTGAIASLTLAQGRVIEKEIESKHDLHLQIARASHAIYNLCRDDASMRRTLLHPNRTEGFDFLRKHYTERDELSTCKITNGDKAVYQALGFSV